MVSPLTVVLYLAACVGLVFLPVNEGGFDRYHLPKELWLAAAALAALAATWRRKLPLDAATALLLALVAAATLSAVFATTPQLTIRGVTLIACAAVLFTTARTCTDDEAQAVRGAVVIASAGIALVALLEAFGVIDGLSATGRAPGSTLGQRNAVAHTLLIVSPAAWSMAARSPQRGERVLGALCTALLVAGIIVTRTRAAWLTLPLAFGVWAAFTSRLDRKALLVPALVLGGSLVLALALPTALKWSSATPYLDTAARLVDTSSGSGAGRLIQYRATLELFGQHPLLGVGPGNWLVEYPTVSPPGDPTFRTEGWLHTGRLANSDVLATAVEGGLVSLALCLALVVALGRTLWRDAEGLGVLVAMLGVCCLDAVVQLPAAAAYAAMLLGLNARRGERDVPRSVRVALALLLAAACFFGAQRVAALQIRTWPKENPENAEAALLYNPWDLQARFSLAVWYTAHSECEKARPHIAVLRALLPNHHQPRQMEAACRVTE